MAHNPWPYGQNVPPYYYPNPNNFEENQHQHNVLYNGPTCSLNFVNPYVPVMPTCQSNMNTQASVNTFYYSNDVVQPVYVHYEEPLRFNLDYKNRYEMNRSKICKRLLYSDPHIFNQPEEQEILQPANLNNPWAHVNPARAGDEPGATSLGYQDYFSGHGSTDNQSLATNWPVGQNEQQTATVDNESRGEEIRKRNEQQELTEDENEVPYEEQGLESFGNLMLEDKQETSRLKCNEAAGNASNQLDVETPRGPIMKSIVRKNLDKMMKKALKVEEHLQKERNRTEKMKKRQEGEASRETSVEITKPTIPNAGNNPNEQNVQWYAPEATGALSNNINQEYFQTNLLLVISEFLRDDTEIEISVAQLENVEKKWVNNVMRVIKNDSGLVNYKNSQQMYALRSIRSSPYHLKQYYEGDLQLVIRKIPPPHLYLITPKELLAEEDDAQKFLECTDDSETENEDPSAELSDMPDDESVEDEEVCFSQYITDRLTSYFLDFARGRQTEMRFVGPFDAVQIDSIYHFMVNLWHCIQDPPTSSVVFKVKGKQIYDVIMSDEFTFDINAEYTILYKTEKRK